MRFETKIYEYTTDEKIIGAEVVVYSEDGDKIDSIIVTDETKLQELEEALETIDETYVQYSNLETLLENLDESTTINATKLNGHQGDAFVLLTDLTDANNPILTTPKPHAVPNTNYGPGTTTNYGHNKIRNDLNAEGYVSGEALSSYQGRVLNNKIESANDKLTNSSLRILIGRYEDMPAGEYGTRIVANRGVNGVYAHVLCDDPDFDAGKIVLYLDIYNNSYEFRATNTQENRKLYDRPDGTVISGRLAIGANSPTGEHILTAFCKYLDNNSKIFPATTIKKIVVV